MIEPGEVLFIGVGTTASCWYRCALPAMALGADWMGAVGRPPLLNFRTGSIKGQTGLPRWSDYKVIVVQQAKGEEWVTAIREFQANGVKVVYEIDDHLHGVAKVKGHDFSQHFGRVALAGYEKAMMACDEMIASTQFLSNRYAKFTAVRHVCENGLDLDRYRLTLPERPKVHFGWSGGTGHDAAVLPWLRVVVEVMRELPDTAFVSVGQRYADLLIPEFGPERALSVPFCGVDVYPAAMTNMDIGLAPSGKGSFWRAKSQLRYLEAGALGIPLIADPKLYTLIEDNANGIHSAHPQRLKSYLKYLATDHDVRRRIGSEARRRVTERHGIRTAADQWREALGIG